MSWKSLSLGDALSVKHGFAFKGTFFSDRGSYLVLTPGNFREHGGFRLRAGKDRWYAGDFPEEYILDERDIIVAMTEQGPGLLGSSAIVPEGNLYLHNQRLGLVTDLDESVLDRKFTYFLFNTRGVRAQINSSASGTKVRHTSPGRICKVRVRVPCVESQARIADILSAYDDLIENNRRRIALLEQAARELYREWFVRLRFPGHESTRIIDGVPDGWKKVSFAELAEFVNGYAFKPAQLGNVGLPIIKIPELKSGITAKTPRNPGDLIPAKYYIHDGDLLFSWSGTLAVNVWTSGDALLNQHLFVVKPTGRVSRALLMFALREARVSFDNQTVGATMRHIRRSALNEVTLYLPEYPLLNAFERMISGVLELIIFLNRQNIRLTEARDRLLPRLMSGEVAV